MIPHQVPMSSPPYYVDLSHTNSPLSPEEAKIFGILRQNWWTKKIFHSAFVVSKLKISSEVEVEPSLLHWVHCLHCLLCLILLTLLTLLALLSMHAFTLHCATFKQCHEGLYILFYGLSTIWIWLICPMGFMSIEWGDWMEWSGSGYPLDCYDY